MEVGRRKGYRAIAEVLSAANINAVAFWNATSYFLING
jgi:hypothetical protein